MLRDTAACKSSTNYVYDLEGKNLVRVARSIFEIAGQTPNTAISCAAIDNSARIEVRNGRGSYAEARKPQSNPSPSRVWADVPKPHRRKMESVLAGGYVGYR